MDARVTYSRKIDHVMAQDCYRFRGFRKTAIASNALAYLKLREKGCSQSSAVAFASKSSCRHDVTREIDGPPSHRLLKVIKDPLSVSQNVLAPLV